jgi:hypothetical protein
VEGGACHCNGSSHTPVMSTLDTIVAELKTLPPPKLEEAADFVRRLHANKHSDRVVALERAASLLTEKDGAELAHAIEDGCEKIDGSDW